MKDLMDHLYLTSELSMEDDSQDLGEESFEGFFTRFFNWDPVRLRSSWKRLSKIDRSYTVAMGTKIPVELLSEYDDYTMDLATRGRQVVKDLSKEVLFDISLLLESEKTLTENIVELQKAIDNNRLDSFVLKDLPMFNRPLLGARSITGSENELDLIKQGNEIKYNTRVTHGYQYGGGNSIYVESTPDRKADERKLREAATYWDNRMTNDVVKSINLLRAITDRTSLITKSMIRGGDKRSKDLVKQLMVWQEMLYEHSYFIVHRTSRFLAKSS